MLNNVRDALVQNAYIESTGDDSLALWGATLRPTNVTFRDCVAVDPGILRPNWYGNCVATYGLMGVAFDNITCRAPTLAHPIPFPQPGSTISRIDRSMFVFYDSFDATCTPPRERSNRLPPAPVLGRFGVRPRPFRGARPPLMVRPCHLPDPPGNNITIDGWRFEDLQSRVYTPAMGTLGPPGLSGKMAWTKGPGADAPVAPYYFPGSTTSGGVNVHVVRRKKTMS